MTNAERSRIKRALLRETQERMDSQRANQRMRHYVVCPLCGRAKCEGWCDVMDVGDASFTFEEMRTMTDVAWEMATEMARIKSRYPGL